MDSKASKSESLNSSLASTLWTSPVEDSFAFVNFSSDHVSSLQKSGPFLSFVLSYWDNILGPRLRHVWLGTGEHITQENCVKYVVSRTLSGELLRDAPENMVDTKLFILKEKDIVCHSFIFTGKDKSGSNISAFSLIVPYFGFKKYLPFVELVEERVKILIAKLRVLQTKDLSTACAMFSTYLPRFVQTITSLQNSGVPEEIQLSDTALSYGQENHPFDKVFLRRALTSHLQTFGSTLVIGQSVENVNLMINTLGLFLSQEERSRSRYAVKSKEELHDMYDPDLFVQGMLKDEDGSFSLPVKGIITSQFPSTLIDIDTMEVKQTCSYNEHCVIRQEFLDMELALIWANQEQAPVYPSLGLFHPVDYIGVFVQTLMNDISLLPAVCDVRKGFISNFLRILDRKALALIKYVEAKSSKGSVALEHMTKRQLRHDLQLTTEADFFIVLVRAEKHKPGLYGFVIGDPRQSVARVQAILESL